MLEKVTRRVTGLLLGIWVVPCSAATWYVDASAGVSGDGKTWGSAFVTVQEGVDAAVNGDAVIVAPGEYWGAYIEEKRICLQSQDPEDPQVVAVTSLGGATLKNAHGSAVKGFIIAGQERGALIHCWGSDCSVSNNIMVSNQLGPSPAVIICTDCSPRIERNLIAANSGEFLGAILCDNASPAIISNTVADNVSPWGFGGVFADGESSPTIINCILWDNGEDLFNCTATYSCIKEARGGEGNIATEPYFVAPENGDYHLLPWSPCIDAGNPNSEFSEEPEPNGGRINMGAYGNTLLAASKSADTDGDALPDEWETDSLGGLNEVGMGDIDGDGILNVDEYLYGWDPKSADPASAENVRSGRLYRTVQAAICESEDGDEIVVLPGTHYENISFFGRAITLRSFDPSDSSIVAATILDGGLSGSTVRFCSREGADTLLEGLTITGGRALRGGGIRCEGASPTISANVITGNVNYLSHVRVGQVLASGGGGGIYSLGGSPIIEDNLIHDNQAVGRGGGVYVEGGSPVVVRNKISSNVAEWGGGGVACISVTASVLSDNVVFANDGLWGGGLTFDWSEAVVLSGNLVVGNLSREPYGLPAGATYFHVTSGLMVSCTIAMNQHFGVSRGHAQEDLNAENCVIWGNEDGAVQPGSCTVSYSCLDEEEPGEGNIFDDPLFMDPEKGDFRLRQGSPCIDAGNNDVLNLPETDILGAPRIVFGGRSRTLDMGAYEYVPLTITKDALGVTLTWGSVPGKTYEIYYAGDLLRYSLAHTVLAVGPVTSWTDERLKTVVAPLRFYRILENP